MAGTFSYSYYDCSGELCTTTASRGGPTALTTADSASTTRSTRYRRHQSPLIPFCIHHVGSEQQRATSVATHCRIQPSHRTPLCQRLCRCSLRIVSHLSTYTRPSSPMAASSPSQPELSAACCSPGTVLDYTPQGTESTVHDLPTYVVGNGPTAVVYVTDIFGYRYVNSRHLADLIASSGPFTVLMPDILSDPIQVDTAVKYGKAAVVPWLLLHSPSSTIPAITHFTGALRQSGQYKHIFACGFCYGAAHVASMLSDGTVDAGIITHSSATDDKYPRSINRPVQFNCAEHDEFFSDNTRHEWEKILIERGVDAQFILYPGTEHGFATRSRGRGWKRGEEEGADDNTELQQKEVHKNIVAFLNKHAAQ